MDGKKWRKTGFGILFVAASFAAVYILMEYHDSITIVAGAAAFLLITAFLFLNEVFSDKVKKRIPQEEGEEQKSIVEEFSGTAADFQNRIFCYMQETENNQKELISVLKNQNNLLQTEIDNLEHEIYLLSEKQLNQTKSIIKFNKENARQLAISERETLEYIMSELKKSIENNAGGTVVRETEEEPELTPELIAAATAMGLEEVTGEEFTAVSDLSGDEELVMQEVPETEEILPLEEAVSEEISLEQSLADLFPEADPVEDIEIPEMPEDMDLSQLFDMKLFDEGEVNSVPEPVEEIPAVVEEPAPAAEEKAEAPAEDPLAGLGGDPNAMMTPEDIAKLLAAMGQ